MSWPGACRASLPRQLAALFTDQVPEPRCVQYFGSGAVPSLAGSHWFFSPATGLAGEVMTQRFMGFWHPFWFECKARVYGAAG